jgi:hypothetical protein
MSRLLKLAVLGGIGYALWKLLNSGFPYTPREPVEPVPAPVRPTAPAPPAATKPAAAPASNGDGSPSSPSKAELYERAKELGIEGRSKMTKQQLERAIADAG